MTLDHAFEQLKTLAEAEAVKGRAEAAKSAADGLNQTVRRLRKAESETDVVSLLVNTDSAHARKAVCLAFENDSALMTAQRGIAIPCKPFLINDAPALISVIESRDTVVTSATAAELSQPLWTAIDNSEPTVHLLPLVVHGSVQMILLAAGDVHIAALELLCEAAGMRLEALAMERAVQSEPDAMTPLVQISGSSAAPPKWSELSQQDQTVHLKAQRFAQVAVARMRVEHSAAVREGQGRADLYGSLRSEIDTARAEYRKQFLTDGSKTMVDYLYLELVRSLANDEDRLLGSSFPGRLI